MLSAFSAGTRRTSLWRVDDRGEFGTGWFSIPEKKTAATDRPRVSRRMAVDAGGETEGTTVAV
jgi:hypothetical protein